MIDQVIQLLLKLDAGPEADDEELAEITEILREELLELDVSAVDFVGVGEVPAKSKSGEPVALGTLLLTLVASGGVLTAIIGMLRDWLTCHEKRSLTLEIDGDKLQVTGISSQEQKRLINAWLTRHQGIVIADD